MYKSELTYLNEILKNQEGDINLLKDIFLEMTTNYGLA